MLISPIAVLATLATPASVDSQVPPGSLDVHWIEGAANCAANPQPPLEVHSYNPETFILRENLCATWEAPFLYLVIGSSKAMLIDTGDVADPAKMPLATAVIRLLPENGSERLPLLVVHTHRHLDHRAGDGQFSGLPNVQVVGFDLESVRRFYNFTDWPNGIAQIDLGERTVDVIPTPGHNETEVSFYDRNTGLFFSGDFLLAGRLLIDDRDADLASANRVAGFVRDRPVSYVLGGHIELDARGQTFPWQSEYHPGEHVLELRKNDLLALPQALVAFNGFYTVSGPFIMMNSVHILIAFAVLGAAVASGFVWILVRYLRSRRRRDFQAANNAIEF
jgi:glyoxylase-like metal-dependent hydrolase (beta-lactamase superfamily II)